MASYDDFWNALGGADNVGKIAQGVGGLYGAYQGASTANGVNDQVQGTLGQNAGALSGAISGLQGNQGFNQGSMNAGVTNNLGILQSLTDPNSAYMQQARQAMERKDAAAGRNSQWGEREVQLQALLAENAAKNAPGLLSSISGAVNPQNQALAQFLQQQQALAQAQNTTGRGAANSATNNMVQGIGGAVGGLSKLFGNGNSAGTATGSLTQSSPGYNTYNPSNVSQDSGITGFYSNPNYDYNYGGAGPETTSNFLGGGNLFDNNNYTGSSVNYTAPDVSAPDWGWGDISSDQWWNF